MTNRGRYSITLMKVGILSLYNANVLTWFPAPLPTSVGSGAFRFEGSVVISTKGRNLFVSVELRTYMLALRVKSGRGFFRYMYGTSPHSRDDRGVVITEILGSGLVGLGIQTESHAP
uniref:Uncharacterized protein n=1 Tax=Candidatus Kentrum sp. SD TaxID=2126332 RepID=A0A451BLC3_9GAMM|nr:MAG: hypothetical protein BECKSD772D_GA0070982_10363 [Candidatus Kentron sp. SD]